MDAPAPSPKKRNPRSSSDESTIVHGYHDSLVRLGRLEEAAPIKQRLDLANGHPDVPPLREVKTVATPGIWRRHWAM